MCCFLASLSMIGPRLALIVYWFLPAGKNIINNPDYHIFWPIVGLIFMPWTALAFTVFFPILGFDWFWLGLALIIDIISYGGAFGTRKSVPGYGGY